MLSSCIRFFSVCDTDRQTGLPGWFPCTWWFAWWFPGWFPGRFAWWFSGWFNWCIAWWFPGWFDSLMVCLMHCLILLGGFLDGLLDTLHGGFILTFTLHHIWEKVESIPEDFNTISRRSRTALDKRHTIWRNIEVAKNWPFQPCCTSTCKLHQHKEHCSVYFLKSDERWEQQSNFRFF